jgi:Txe/YoeB family toxin of Txe-Axe toxin-antitoxin module|tara:strand:- start:339 stop:668 length:330 start_codon:yes stop_codon:yes gene_type:complete
MKSEIKFADKKLKNSLDKLRYSKIENKKLYEWLNRALDDLEDNPYCGIQIPKRLIPKIYIKKYSIDNLWKYDLPSSWRLIYSVTNDSVEVISIILEWMDHKEYDRRFNY